VHVHSFLASYVAPSYESDATPQTYAPPPPLQKQLRFTPPPPRRRQMQKRAPPTQTTRTVRDGKNERRTDMQARRSQQRTSRRIASQ